MKCEECEYFESIYESDNSIGHCHRFPPNQDGQGISTEDEFSVVKGHRWCGEFKKKGAKK